MSCTPPLACGEGGWLKVLEKFFLVGGDQKFVFWWRGKGYIVVGVLLLEMSRNFEVKIEIAKYQYKECFFSIFQLLQMLLLFENCTLNIQINITISDSI